AVDVKSRQLHALMWNGLSEHGAHLCDDACRGRRHDRTKVHLSVAKGQIAVSVCAIGAYESEVPFDGLFENELTAAEASHLFSLRELRPYAHRCVEGRNASAAGPDPLGKSTLRHAFELDLAIHPLPLERRGLLAVTSGGSAYDLAHEAGFNELVRHRITVGCRVYDDRQ